MFICSYETETLAAFAVCYRRAHINTRYKFKNQKKNYFYAARNKRNAPPSKATNQNKNVKY